jgi:hypothetical protein
MEMESPLTPETSAASRPNQVHQAAALLRELGLFLESQLAPGTVVTVSLQVCSSGDDTFDVMLQHQYPTAGISGRGYARYALAGLDMGEVLAWCASKVGAAPSESGLEVEGGAGSGDAAEAGEAPIV